MARSIERADATRLRWRSGTCFGRLVVPLVCSSSATSSAPPSVADAPAARWRGRRLGSRGRTNVDDRDRARRGTGSGQLTLGHEEQARREVLEVERELVLRVGRIQRSRSGAERRQGEDQFDQLRAVRQGQTDQIAPANAVTGEPGGERLDVVRELTEAEPEIVLGYDESGPPSVAGAPDGGERLARRHDRSAIQTVFRSEYFSSEWIDLSRPKPDCLKPPNGAEMSPVSKC